jgi:hypothetical protein
MMNANEFVSAIASVRPQATFLTLHGYRAESGEVADHQIVFHVSYRTLLERSVVALNALQVSDDLQAQAKGEVFESLTASLAKVEETTVEDIEDAYERFFDDSGAHIKGIKRHIESGVMHLYGTTVQKRVIVPGTYKEVKSKPLTIAKNKIRASLPVSKWRQYRVKHDQLDRVSVDSLKLLPPLPF